MKKLPFFFLFIALIPGLTACSGSAGRRSGAKDDSGSFSQGRLNGSTYTNPYFHLSLSVPDDWDILPVADEEAFHRFEADLFMAFQWPVDSGYIDNANISVRADRKTHDTRIADGKDYLLDLQNGLQALSGETLKTGAVGTTKLGGRSFDTMTTQQYDASEDLETWQEYYVTLNGDYWLVITLTYHDDDQKQALHAVLKTVRA